MDKSKLDWFKKRNRVIEYKGWYIIKWKKQDEPHVDCMDEYSYKCFKMDDLKISTSNSYELWTLDKAKSYIDKRRDFSDIKFLIELENKRIEKLFEKLDNHKTIYELKKENIEEKIRTILRDILLVENGKKPLNYFKYNQYNYKLKKTRVKNNE